MTNWADNSDGPTFERMPRRALRKSPKTAKKHLNGSSSAKRRHRKRTSLKRFNRGLQLAIVLAYVLLLAHRVSW